MPVILKSVRKIYHQELVKYCSMLSLETISICANILSMDYITKLQELNPNIIDINDDIISKAKVKAQYYSEIIAQYVNNNGLLSGMEGSLTLSMIALSGIQIDLHDQQKLVQIVQNLKKSNIEIHAHQDHKKNIEKKLTKSLSASRVLVDS